MNKTNIAVIIFVVVVGGVALFIGMNKRAEAPVGEVKVSVPSLGASATTGALKEFTVAGQNFSFIPSLITVKKGDKVKITFKNSSGFHDFKIDEFSVASKQTKSPTEEVVEFTADKVGSFQYYCSVGTHRDMGMFGILKVE